MNNSRAAAIDSSALLRSAPAVSSAELSNRIARRCGAPKKLDGPPPPTIPTRNLRWLIVVVPLVSLDTVEAALGSARLDGNRAASPSPSPDASTRFDSRAHHYSRRPS